jgi:hypothetical protein
MSASWRRAATSSSLGWFAVDGRSRVEPEADEADAEDAPVADTPVGGGVVTRRRCATSRSAWMSRTCRVSSARRSTISVRKRIALSRISWAVSVAGDATAPVRLGPHGMGASSVAAHDTTVVGLRGSVPGDASGKTLLGDGTAPRWVWGTVTPSSWRRSPRVDSSLA